MAGSPAWKVYRCGRYVAACKEIEDAAAIVAQRGGEIRHGHSTKSRVYCDIADDPLDLLDAVEIAYRVQCRMPALQQRLPYRRLLAAPDSNKDTNHGL